MDARRRRALVVWLVFGVGLFAGSYLIYALSDWYVPQRVGGRRLVPYELFVPVVAATIALWAAGRGWRAVRARLPLPGARLLPAVLGTVVVLVTIASPAATAQTDEPGLTRVGYDAYAWMRTNLPPDSRILANAYTDGSLTFLSGGAGILDGRAVYLEDPAFLRETTSLLLGARRFFLAPSDPSFLTQEKVNYLLVVGPRGSAADLAGYRPFPNGPGRSRVGTLATLSSRASGTNACCCTRSGLRTSRPTRTRSDQCRSRCGCSLLRVVGVVVALVMIGVVIIATRRGTTRAIVTPLLLVGIGLLGISAAPDIVRPVQDFIGLGDRQSAGSSRSSSSR